VISFVFLHKKGLWVLSFCFRVSAIGWFYPVQLSNGAPFISFIINAERWIKRNNLF